MNIDKITIHSEDMKTLDCPICFEDMAEPYT